MSSQHELASRLTASLELATPPVAIAFAAALPEGVSAFDGDVPAGCSFWQLASDRSFATSASDHALCAIGVHTHNLAEPAASHETELTAALGAMTGLDYVREDEVAAIPVLDSSPRHVIYGPLAELPVDAAIVMLFVDAQQGLIVSEAVARVDGAVPLAMGRPACAVVPQVANSGRAALSLGCCGARAYLDKLSPEIGMWALPGEKLDAYCEAIGVLAAANRTLTAFHANRRLDVASGQRPSVQESLAKLDG